MIITVRALKADSRYSKLDLYDLAGRVVVTWEGGNVGAVGEGQDGGRQMNTKE